MDRPTSTAKLPTVVLANLALATAYAVTGFAGLKLAFVGHAVTLFWPPSGLAFAAVWLGGRRLLPGVFLGALIVNLDALPSPLLAIMVGVGSTLPPLASTTLLRRVLARRGTRSDLQDVLAFIAIAVFGCTTLSAAVGAGAVAAAQLPGGESPMSVSAVWWLGDAMGVLVVAPPLLFARRWAEHRWTLRLSLEACGFALAGGATITTLVAVREPAWAPEVCKLFTFVLSLWAGARFGLHGATAITLLMAVGAAGATAAGAGPFVRGDYFESFVLLHSYLFAQALAALLLAAALADLNRTLAAERSARSAAEAAAASQFRLLTTISHDVRTPLNGVAGVLQTLQAARLGRREARLVELALRASGTLSALVAELLESARVRSGRLRIVEAPFSCAASLDDLVRLNGKLAADAGLALVLTGKESLPAQVRGDRVRFEQVVGNLIANALAYTPAGEVRISAAWAAGARLPLVVEVSDTGPGIPPMLAPQIFEPYVQGRPQGRAGASAGLGLGLDISRRLSRAMGGDLAYSPRPGGGSTFRLELPLPAVPASRHAARSRSAPPADPPMAILLVDDDDIGREVTAALLQARGHTVHAVAAENAAVEAAASRVFDLVLMDIQLSGGDSGLAAARRIRALPGQSARLRILALTADAFGDPDSYRDAGLDGILLKPLGLEDDLTLVLGREATD